jgi:adenosine kinase
VDIFVSGSLALDRIMDFPGLFSDHILPDKVHMLNVSFNVNGIVERFGGTAGNIAYALSLLGEKPRILATIGRDYEGYFRWLDENGTATDGIKIIDEEFTASAYITTDRADNQITGFNPGAMKRPSSFEFDEIDPRESIVIVAPGNLDDMKDYPRVCRAKGIPYIFDPGQSLPMWDGNDLAQAIEGSRVLVSNDYELEMISRKTGFGRERLIDLTETIVTTRGEKGSIVHTKGGRIDVPAVKVDRAVDPTGAGDAYRAGLIKGLVQGNDLRYCAALGTVVASFAVECRGTQEYTFAMREFEARLKEYLTRISIC